MYALEHKNEAERLEKQALQKNYSLEEELQFLSFEKGACVLDAGCGSGLLCRYLAENHSDKNLKITGFDFSEIRVQQAKESIKKYGLSNIKIEHQNLEDIKSDDEKFDVIICRYVIEHLSSPMTALSELHRILRVGGVIYLIDFDGIWVNTYTGNEKFNLMMKKVENNLNVDFTVGRKMGVMLSKLNFKNINLNISQNNFKAEELQSEIANNIARCNLLWPKLIEILGSEEEAVYFRETFSKEMLKPETAVFHNKFIVKANK